MRVPQRCPTVGRMALTKDDPKAVGASVWALGDYHRFARETVWELGPMLVEAAGVAAGHRVLDVAAGTGNVAIRAAEAGADVVASDVTPENFAAGRREADARGVEVEWVEADAQALPFEAASFDVVTSCFGAIFAPDHRAVADELLRVCRPGGAIVMANFTPDGSGAAFFALLATFMPPPPPGAPAPTLWGDEAHVRRLFGNRVISLELERRSYVERSRSPQAYRELFETAFGPIVALRRALGGDPTRLAEFDGQLAEFTVSANRATPGAAAEYPYDYLLVVARR